MPKEFVEGDRIEVPEERTSSPHRIVREGENDLVMNEREIEPEPAGADLEVGHVGWLPGCRRSVRQAVSFCYRFTSYLFLFITSYLFGR